MAESYFPTGKNDYLISGNLTNVFAIGEVGSPDDFFIIGSETSDEVPYPMLTANYLDSEGNILFRIVRNIFVINPHNCHKFIADLSGYEIQDSAGKLILKVTTKFDEKKGFITTIQSQGYNKKGELVFDANESSMKISTKFAIGYDKQSGNIGEIDGYSEEDHGFIRSVLSSDGRIYEPLKGIIKNQKIRLDGKVIIDGKLENCEVEIFEGDFTTIGPCNYDTCNFVFGGNAANIINFIRAAEKSNTIFTEQPGVIRIGNQVFVKEKTKSVELDGKFVNVITIPNNTFALSFKTEKQALEAYSVLKSELQG